MCDGGGAGWRGGGVMFRVRWRRCAYWAWRGRSAGWGRRSLSTSPKPLRRKGMSQCHNAVPLVCATPHMGCTLITPWLLAARITLESCEGRGGDHWSLATQGCQEGDTLSSTEQSWQIWLDLLQFQWQQCSSLAAHEVLGNILVCSVCSILSMAYQHTPPHVECVLEHVVGHMLAVHIEWIVLTACIVWWEKSHKNTTAHSGVNQSSILSGGGGGETHHRQWNGAWGWGQQSSFRWRVPCMSSLCPC